MLDRNDTPPPVARPTDPYAALRMALVLGSTILTREDGSTVDTAPTPLIASLLAERDRLANAAPVAPEPSTGHWRRRRRGTEQWVTLPEMPHPHPDYEDEPVAHDPVAWIDPADLADLKKHPATFIICRLSGQWKRTDKERTPLYTDPLSAEVWAELHRLRHEIQGPDGFATWKDAAIAERIKRVAVEKRLAAPPTDERILSIALDVALAENVDDPPDRYVLALARALLEARK